MIDPKELEPPVPEDEIAAAAEQPADTPDKETPKEEVAPKKDTVVPHAALHEERERRKELQRELQQTREDQARRDAVLQDRMNQLYAMQHKEQPKPIPEYDQDPLTNLNARLAQQTEELTKLREAQTHSTQQQQRWAQQQQFVSSVQSRMISEESKFTEANPDYPDAARFLQEGRVKELKAMGNTPEQIVQVMRQDVLGLAVSCFQRGQNPAEAAYELAKARGYAKKASQEQKMDSLQKGVEASKTLAGGGSSANPTVEQIAAMSDEEYAAFKSKLGGKRVSDLIS